MRSETENQPQQRKSQPGRSMNASTSSSWKMKASGLFTAAALFLLIVLSSRAFAVTVARASQASSTLPSKPRSQQPRQAPQSTSVPALTPSKSSSPRTCIWLEFSAGRNTPQG
jgi:hypothetical protein